MPGVVPGSGSGAADGERMRACRDSTALHLNRTARLSGRERLPHLLWAREEAVGTAVLRVSAGCEVLVANFFAMTARAPPESGCEPAGPGPGRQSSDSLAGSDA